MTLVIHGMIDSGNCWKPRLLCHLGLAFRHAEVSTRDGSTAHEGGFALARFPGVMSWTRRVEALPGYRPQDAV